MVYENSERKLIDDNWDLLENKEFNKLYDVLYYNSNLLERSSENGHFSNMLLNAGINPLDYFKNYIPQWAFYRMDVSNLDLVIPEGITKVCYNAFYKCKCKSIKLPSTLKSIDLRAFSNLFTEVPIEIPDSVTEIGDYAFTNIICDKFTDIIIPDSVDFIGDYAFIYNKSINSIEVKNPNCIIGKGSFSLSDFNNLKSVVLPSKYKNAVDIRRIFEYKNTLELRKRVKFTWI